MGYPIHQCQDNWSIRPEPLTNGDVGGWFGTVPLLVNGDNGGWTGTDLLMELCLYNASGYEILNTIINHNCTIEDLYDQSVSGTNIYRGELRKIYGPPTKMLTPGLTIDEVADVLETYGFGKDIHMVEWSTGFCDYNQERH